MKIIEFLFFRRMLIPVIIQLIFWLSTAICFYVGIFGLFHQSIIMGIGVMIFGPLIIRLVCEYTIVLFRINDTLTDIRNEMVRRGDS